MSILRHIEKRISKEEKTFNLLYSSNSTVNAEDFHVKCDGKGPTVTVLYGKHNTIFGGYTSKDWCPSNKKVKKDDTAFLFFKHDNAEAACLFLPVKKDMVDRAITCDAKFGPTFGGGIVFWKDYDLQTFKSDSKNESESKEGYIHLNGNINIGCAYDVEDVNNKIQVEMREDIKNTVLIIKRIEVYQVVDERLPEPWRKMPKNTELAEMKRNLEHLEPIPGLGIKTYNILLVGAIGSGKSSFYNTLATVFSDSIKVPAPARDAPISVTNEVHGYELKSRNGTPLNLRIFDIRGFEAERGYDHELELLLNGRLPVGFCFPDQPEHIEENTLKNASLKDEIHLVCFVTGTAHLDTITGDLHERISAIRKTINKKGLQMVVVATKFDELCPKIAKDADSVYKSPKARDSTKAVSDFFGIQENHVFPIVNYVNDEKIKVGKNRLALQALDKMVSLTKDYLENHREMAPRLDMWSERANKQQVPKHRNEKEKILKKLGAELTELGDKVLRVLCVGAVHSGKSSLIDSMSSTLRDEICSTAAGGYASGGTMHDGQLVSTTERFDMYQMRYKHESGDLLKSNVFFGDLPGFQESGGITLENVKHVIRGHVPKEYKIKDGIERDSRRFIQRPQKKDMVHCVCFVFDISSAADKMSGKIQEKFKSLQRWLFDKKIPYVAIVTKGDLLSEVVKQHKLQVFEIEHVKENKDKLIKMFEFKQSRIFPVINYIHEDTVVPESDELLISAFREILKLGKERLEGIDEDDNTDESGEEDCKKKRQKEYVPKTLLSR